MAALSDDVAYNNHDIDDGLRAGLISLQDLHGLPLTGEVLHALQQQHGDLPEKLQRHELRELISIMICDLTEETTKRIEAIKRPMLTIFAPPICQLQHFLMIYGLSFWN